MRNSTEPPTLSPLFSVNKLKPSFHPHSRSHLSLLGAIILSVPVRLSSIWATMLSTFFCYWLSSQAVTVSSACVVLPSQAPVLSPDPLGSPGCFSNPVIILLATLPTSLLPATGNACACQPETCFFNTDTNNCVDL